jgi:hypothetical protein
MTVEPKQLTTTYGYPPVEISYNEHNDTWEFELRNKQRQATTLALAKQAIDKPPLPDKKTFERIPVYVAYGQKYERAEITSLVQTKYSSYEAWVTYLDGNMKGKRERKSMYYLYAITDDNRALINQVDALWTQIEGLQRKRNEITSQLPKLEIKPEDYD